MLSCSYERKNNSIKNLLIVGKICQYFSFLALILETFQISWRQRMTLIMVQNTTKSAIPPKEDMSSYGLQMNIVGMLTDWLIYIFLI